MKTNLFALPFSMLRLLCAGLMLGAFLSASHVRAADVVWDGGASGTGQAWTNGPNWAGDIVPTSADNAVFDSTGSATIITVNSNGTSWTFGVGALTVGAGRSASFSVRTLSTGTSGTLAFYGANGVLVSNASSTASLIFTNASSGGAVLSLALAASGDIYANAPITNYSVLSEIGGSRGFNKTGPGLFYLRAVNTYTGPTTITAGDLEVDDVGTLGNGAGTLFLSGGNLQIGASRAGTGTTTPIANPIVLTADSAINNKTGTATTRFFALSGSLSGSAGTLRFSNLSPTAGNAFTPRLFGGGFNFSRPMVIGDPVTDINAAVFTVLELGNYPTNGTQTFSGNISGYGSVRRISQNSSLLGGDTIFTGSNTWSGGTFINSGAIYANNTTGSALGTGPVCVTNANALLAGNGTILASVSVSTNGLGGTISPGSVSTNIGKLTVNDLTLSSNAVYNWNITAATGTAGVNWDSITATTSWTDSANAATPITLKVDSLGATPTGWNAAIARDWVIIQSASGIGFDATHFAIDTSSFVGTISGIFALTNISGSLHLLYTPAADTVINVVSGTVTQGQTTPTPYPLLSGAVGVQKVGNGEVVLTNSANSYQGVTKIYAGTVSLAVDANNNSGAFGAASSPVLLGNTLGTSNATLNISVDGVTCARPVQVQSGSSGVKTIGTTLTSGNANFSGDIALQDNVRLTAASGGAALFSGNITGTGGLTLSGGTLTLNGVNSYSGVTTISNGTFNFNHAKALGSNTVTFASAGVVIDNSGTTNVTLNNNPPQNWNANLTFTGTTNLNLGAGPVTMSANRTITVNASTLTVGGVIGGTAGLTKLGSGTLILAGATNSTYTGGTTNLEGVLGVNATASFGDGTGPLVLAGGSILANATRSSAPIANPVLMTTNTTIYGDSTSSATRLFPMSGNWTVTGGAVLRLGNTGTNNNTFEAMLTSGQDLTWPVVVGDPAFDVNGGSTVLAFYGDNTKPAQTISALISGTGGVRRGNLAAGAGGTTIFASDSTYSGGTVLDSGTLGIALDSTGTPGAVTSGPLGTGTFEIVNDPVIKIFASGGARTIANRIFLNGVTNATFIGTNALTFTGDMNLGATTAKTLTSSNSASVTFSGTLTNAASLSFAGNGVFILSGQNVNSGTVQLNSGSLGIVGSSIGSPGAVTSGPLGTGRFNLGAQTSEPAITVFALNGPVTIDNNLVFNGDTNMVFGGTNNMLFTGAVNSGGIAKTITVTNGITTTFAGAITNTGSSTGGALTKTGAGTLVLSGSSTYAGTTTVENGTLLINGAIFTNTVTAIAGTLGGTGSISGPVVYNSGAQARFSKSAGSPDSPLTISNNLTLNGNTVIVDLGGTTSLGAGTYTLATYAGALTGTFNATPTLVNGSLAGGNAATISLSATNKVNLVVAPGGGLPPNFQPASVTVLGNGNILLTATGSIGATYKLWASTNVGLTPITNTWTLLQSGTVTSTPFGIQDPNATNYTKRFYIFSTQ